MAETERRSHQFNPVDSKITKSHSGHGSIQFQPLFAKLTLLAMGNAGTLSRAKQEVDPSVYPSPLYRDRGSKLKSEPVLRA